MKEEKRLRLKKFYFHPITIYIFLIMCIMLLSGILSSVFEIFGIDGTYNIINAKTHTLEPGEFSQIKNMFGFEGMKFIISNAVINFSSFPALSNLIISLIGITIAEASGLIETFSKRYLKKIPKFTLTFIILLLATISSLINDVGYGILIPLTALIYFINGRNPILGIITAFCGVSFGYGVSIFVGSTEVALNELTRQAAMTIDEAAHISLTCNLIFIVITSFILSFIGSVIIEKIISPKIGKYKKEEEFATTEQYRVINLEEEEQKRIEQEKNEKNGLRISLIVGLIVILIFIYAIIPGLPYSGMLLDMTQSTYVNRLFGVKSYFQDGFTFLVALFFISTGIAYGIGAKTIKNDKDLMERAHDGFNNIGSAIILLFAASQFYYIFKETNIGPIIAAKLAQFLGFLHLSGVVLIVVTLVFIALANIFLPATTSKWTIFSPIVVPLFMQSNISPQFAQIVMRAGDSMTNGITPMLPAAVIFIAYLNIYNLNKDKPYTFKRAFSLIMPYFILISVSWILIVVGWYLLGLPIGPNVLPTI